MSVDSRAFNLQMRRLVIATGQPSNVIVKEEAMRFLRQLIKFTPPSVSKATGAALKANNPGFKNATVKRVATRAILGDLLRAVSPISLDPKHPLLIRAIKENSAEVLQKFLDLPAGKVFGHTAVKSIPATHYAARNRRGRVENRTGAVTLEKKAWKKHYLRIQKRIGYMKCGWLRAWNKLKTVKGWQPLPQMVSRHSGYARGGGRVIKQRNGIAIFLMNSTPGIKVLQNAVSSATRARTQAMARRIQKIIKAAKPK